MEAIILIWEWQMNPKFRLSHLELIWLLKKNQNNVYKIVLKI